MKRILIGDDHAMVRKGLLETLGEELEDLLFGEAENSQQVLQLVWDKEWDLVILDINMEGRSGLEVLGEIRKSKPKIPVLVLSMYPVAEFAVRALKSGAAGYLNKQTAPDEVVAAVKPILSGSRYINTELAERLADDLQRQEQGPPHLSLSTRETQVMLMISAGKSLKEIAAELSISVKTVGTYHARILQKMRLKNDIELTRYVLLNKLAS
jgi:two-component system invasion response regulator UvrY